jgi:hypothetical protein
MMAAAATVLASIEDGSGLRCVDIFRRPDGSFGFDEYRRDPEDGGRWTQTGYHGGRAFAARAEAEAAARIAVPWLSPLFPAGA